MKNKLPKELQPKEHQIQTQIIHYLEDKGYYVQRMNSGRFPTGEGRSKRFITGAKKGTPDIMAFKKNCRECAGDSNHDVRLLFVEVKAGDNVPSEAQVEKMYELTQYGAKCILAYGLEDLQKAGI